MSDNNEVLERLKNLEKEKKQKDFWDKLQILSSIIVPILLTYVGGSIGDSVAKFGEAQEKLAKAEVQASIIELVTDKDNSRRKLGVAAVKDSPLEKGIREEILKTVKDDLESVKDDKTNKQEVIDKTEEALDSIESKD